MAWLLAPDALISASKLSHDPRTSYYAADLADVPINNGAAEEVVLLKPDLVLAGTYTTRSTVQLLQELGYRVEIFPPINSIQDAQDNLLRMGALLDRRDAAQQMADALEPLINPPAPPADAPRVALYYPSGATSGTDTVPGTLMRAAGLNNIAAEKGLPFGRHMPLEELVMADPDIVVIGQPYNGHARATELLSHPALSDRAQVYAIQDGAAWVCETPALLKAVEELSKLGEPSE